MTNPFLDYYKQQAGTGIAGFRGVKFQKGHGFFGRVLSNAVFPLLKFLGKKAAGVGADIASDVIVNRKGFKDSIKERFKEGGSDIANAGIERARKYVQTGQGRRRKRKRLQQGKGKKKSIKRKKLSIEDLINKR